MRAIIFIGFCLIFTMAGACGQSSPIDHMKKEVPLYNNAVIIKMDDPDEKTSVIQYKVPATDDSEEEKIIEFYKDSLEKKGWAFQEDTLKIWKKNGSVFSFEKPKLGKLLVQTITRGVDKKKKITVVLNWTRS